MDLAPRIGVSDQGTQAKRSSASAAGEQGEMTRLENDMPIGSSVGPVPRGSARKGRVQFRSGGTPSDKNRLVRPADRDRRPTPEWRKRPRRDRRPSSETRIVAPGRPCDANPPLLWTNRKPGAGPSRRSYAGPPKWSPCMSRLGKIDAPRRPRFGKQWIPTHMPSARQPPSLVPGTRQNSSRRAT